MDTPDEPTYCDCDDLGCDQEHEPLSDGMQALVDGKIAIQKLSHRIDANTILGGIALVMRQKVWQLTHEAYGIGIDAGRADGIDSTQRAIASWIRQLGPIAPTHTPERILQIVADGIDRGDYITNEEKKR